MNTKTVLVDAKFSQASPNTWHLTFGQGAWEDGKRHGKGIQDALIETKGVLPRTPPNLGLVVSNTSEFSILLGMMTPTD